LTEKGVRQPQEITMTRNISILSTALIFGMAAPAFAASMSADEINMRLVAQAVTEQVAPEYVRTDENDEPLSTSGYMAVPSSGKIMLDVQFKVGSTNVTNSGGKQIDAMRKMPNMPSIHLIGHTDRSGDWQKNLDISQRRAAAVKDYIVTDCELPGGLILTSGEGEAFAPRTGKANNADDRRIEVQLIGMPEPEVMDAEESEMEESTSEADNS
jgi:outer membrane protein OmpA-like peptidoglycan-associated protein